MCHRTKCCFCFNVAIGSCIFALIVIVGSFLSLLGIILSGEGEDNRLWVIIADGAFSVLQLLSGVSVIVAIAKDLSLLMVPILVMTVITIILAIAGFVLAIIAIFDKNSPLAQNLMWFYNNIDWFHDSVDDWFGGPDKTDDYIQAYSIALAIIFALIFLIGLWIFLTHFDTYRTIKAREGLIVDQSAPIDAWRVESSDVKSPPPYVTAIYDNGAHATEDEEDDVIDTKF